MGWSGETREARRPGTQRQALGEQLMIHEESTCSRSPGLSSPCACLLSCNGAKYWPNGGVGWALSSREPPPSQQALPLCF